MQNTASWRTTGRSSRDRHLSWTADRDTRRGSRRVRMGPRRDPTGGEGAHATMYDQVGTSSTKRGTSVPGDYEAQVGQGHHAASGRTSQHAPRCQSSAPLPRAIRAVRRARTRRRLGDEATR